MVSREIGMLSDRISTTELEINPNPMRRILHIKANVGARAVSEQLLEIRPQHPHLAATCPTRRRLSHERLLQIIG